MVDLKLEAMNTENFSKDMYISVRIGEMQKLSKVSASRTYKFSQSAVGERRYGKVEILKRIGGASVAIDPNAVKNGIQEVCVPFEGKDFKFQVSLAGGANAKAVEEKPAANSINPKVQAAKDYLEKHQLELRLSEAMQAVLRERPEDPGAFVAARLLENKGLVTRIPATPAAAGVAPVAAGAAPATASSKTAAILPFTPYYKANLKMIPPETFAKLHAKFPGASRKGPAVVEAAPGFAQMPSVGTWITPLSDRKKAAAKEEFTSNLRSKSKEKLFQAAEDGTLERAAGPAIALVDPVYDLKAKVSQQLAAACMSGDLETVAKRAAKGKRYIIPTTTLFGSMFYSTGMRPNVRAI